MIEDRPVFISRRSECGAGATIVMFVAFMVGVAVVQTMMSPPPEPKEVLAVYNRLVGQSQSLDKMAGDVRELDGILTRNWAIGTAVRLEDRMRLQREVNELGREYAEVAGEYNFAMRQSGYRFADPAKLPLEAKFGPLPRRYEPFILLKSGPRA